MTTPHMAEVLGIGAYQVLLRFVDRSSSTL